MFDFNSTPLSPLGTKFIVCEPKPQHSSTWSDRGQHGWYIGPAPTHYRNYNIYINTTQDARHSVTAVFLPSKLSIPATSTTNHLIIILTDLLHKLKHPHPATPFTDFGAPTNNAIRTLQNLFHTIPPASTTATSSPGSPLIASASKLPLVPPMVLPIAPPSPRVPPLATPSPRVPTAATPPPSASQRHHQST